MRDYFSDLFAGEILSRKHMLQKSKDIPAVLPDKRKAEEIKKC